MFAAPSSWIFCSHTPACYSWERDTRSSPHLNPMPSSACFSSHWATSACPWTVHGSQGSCLCPCPELRLWWCRCVPCLPALYTWNLPEAAGIPLVSRYWKHVSIIKEREKIQYNYHCIWCLIDLQWSLFKKLLFKWFAKALFFVTFRKKKKTHTQPSEEEQLQLCDLAFIL